MKVFYSEKHLHHLQGEVYEQGTWRAGRDVPERIGCLLSAACRLGFDPVEVSDMQQAPAASIHTPQYMTFLETAYAVWVEMDKQGERVIPSSFPIRQLAAGYPDSIVGRAGYHMQDQLSPIGEHTWTAALSAANVAWAAATHLLQAREPTYALCRPSGHHASTDKAGGATYLNNAAIATQCLRQHHSRVALLDIDVHHGNGSQEIFYQRADVLFISIHRDPTDYFPYFSGYATEQGEGDGIGFTVNLPLPAGSDDSVFTSALAEAINRISAFKPGALVVSLGFDGHRDDPADGFNLSSDAFYQAGQQIRSLGLPVVFVQEGGYALEHLGDLLTSFFNGYGFRDIYGCRDNRGAAHA
jgi:acetoin utilization deacetylase AcuC-like enzyme